MYFRQLLNDETGCASYLFGCNTAGELAVVDPHADLVEEYVDRGRGPGLPDRRRDRDPRSGRPRLGLARAGERATGATPTCLRARGWSSSTTRSRTVRCVKLGNTVIQAVATPGHAGAHHAYLVTDHRRGEEPWIVLTGDALLVGDAGRPDLHAHGEQTVEEMARTLYRSLTERLLALPDHLLLYPAHYSGSVCGRGLSGNPSLDDRVRAPPQRRSRLRVRGRVRRRADRGHPTGARAPGRDHRGQPLGRRRCRPSLTQPGLSWDCARTRPSSRSSSPSTPWSGRWSASSARPCR